MSAWHRLVSRLKCEHNPPRRWLVHGALALAAGVFVGYRLEMHIFWLLAAALGLLLAMLLRKYPRLSLLGAMLFFFFTGVAVCAYQAHPSVPPTGKYYIRATATGEAKVREEDGRIALYIRDAQITGETGETYRLNKLYWTYWPEEDALPPLDGQQVEFVGKVYQPSGQENPYGFDFKLYLLQKDVTAGVSGAEDLVKSPADQTDHKSVLLRIRRAIGERLHLLLQDQSPLAEALLIGQTDDMPEEMRADFRKAGVAHVLSVSGLHAVLIMGLVIKLLERLQASPRVIFAATGVMLIFYSLLVGAGAPILRAAVLVGYQLYAHVVRRRGDSLTAWALGLMIILLLQPLQLFAAGFQMSFAAVLGMVMLGDAVRPVTLRIRNNCARRLCAAYLSTLCANLGVMLPVIYAYNSVSLIGLLINPFVCLMTEALMVLEILLLLVSLLSLPFAMHAGAVLAHLSRFTIEGVGLMGSVSFASVHVPSPPWYLAAAIALCLTLCTRYVNLRMNRRILLGGAALMISCAVMIFTRSYDVRYTQLAMGDADAAVIEDGRETIVIDTGEYGGDLSSYLLATGRSADHLILTHLHTDHALGLEHLMADDVKIGQMYLSTEALKTEVSPSVMELLALAQERGVPVQLVSAGERIKTPRVTMDILWPEEGSGHAIKDANDCAMALKIDLAGARMLHMSDLPGTYEQYVAQPADILRAAHHGSQHSTQEDFLLLTQPAVCLISGDDPSEKTLSRLANVGAMVYDTGTYGAVTVTVREGQYFIEGYLQ